MIRRVLTPASVLVAGLLLGTAASAQNITGPQLQALRTACEADVKKLCTGVQPGGGRLIQCLREHQSDVTPPCKDSIAALAAVRKQ